MNAAIDSVAIAEQASRLSPSQRQCLLERISALRPQGATIAGVGGGGAGGKIDAVIASLRAQAAREANEALLADKLAAAGALRPAHLLAAISQGRLSLFAAALARLGGFTPDQARAAIDEPAAPDLLAIACVAAGIDKAAFPALLERLRRTNTGKPGGGDSGARRALGVFGLFSPAAAARAVDRVAPRV